MCFSKAKKKKRNRKKMDLLNIGDMLPIKATFSVVVRTCGSPWPERNYTLVKERRKNQKKKRI